MIEQNEAHGCAQYVIVDRCWLIAANIRPGAGSMTADLYRNLDDYEFGFVMERDVTFELDQSSAI